MKRLWCPWRIQYIRSPKPKGCVLCDAPLADDPAENLVLFRGQHAYVMLNRYPYTNGHLMVVPYAHVAMLTELPLETQIEMLQEINLCLEVLQEVMQPAGFNIGLNLGAAAGAGIKDHLHFHVVPRWIGDTNFMAVVGETCIIVEDLKETYAALKPAFERRCPEKDQHPLSPPRREVPPKSSLNATEEV